MQSRTSVYRCFGRRRDAPFELLDSLVAAGPVPAPVHLSLEPTHRRGWGSLYAALARGSASTPALEARLATRPITSEQAIGNVYGGWRDG